MNDEVESLRKENAQLHERLGAFERSRWWRLHPRLALRRAIAGTGAGRDVTDVEHPADAHLDRFRAEVVARGVFTEDWFTRSIPRWQPIVGELEGRGARVLEIGAFEGLSACYVLWRLPDAHLTCIDMFSKSRADHDTDILELDELEARFDHNVALVDSARVRKLVGDSKRVLLELLADGAQFDLVYVDGSHAGLDVLVDAALSWQLLSPDGFVIFDDYRLATHGPDPLLRPGPAIDAFRNVIDKKYEVVIAGYQLGLRKQSA